MKTGGWGRIFRSVKWHYFDAERLSLCSRSMALSDADLVQGNDDSPENCKRCRELRAKATVTKGAKS